MRKDAHTFIYQNHHRGDGSQLAGELTLELLSDGTSLLSGKWATAEACATCPREVGYIEFIVLSPTSIYQNKAAHGPDHDHYVEWWPPYRYKWLGPLSTVAQ